MRDWLISMAMATILVTLILSEIQPKLMIQFRYFTHQIFMTQYQTNKILAMIMGDLEYQCLINQYFSIVFMNLGVKYSTKL